MGEEEEDVDEEDEEALGEEEEGDGEIFLFVVTQPRHFVLHIPNTPPHHHLCSRNKARRDRLRQFEKNTPIQRAKCQTNPYQKTTEHPLQSEKKNQSKRWCFLSNKKRILSSPPLKTEISLEKSNEKLFALFCSCEFVLVINLSRQKKTKNYPKVT